MWSGNSPGTFPLSAAMIETFFRSRYDIIRKKVPAPFTGSRGLKPANNFNYAESSSVFRLPSRGAVD